jgi:hypothetical protein
MRGAVGRAARLGCAGVAGSAAAGEFFHIRLGLEIEYHRTVREEAAMSLGQRDRLAPRALASRRQTTLTDAANDAADRW